MSVSGGDGDVRPGRRVVVTGGAGFIGGHLVDRLVADGDEVLVVDDLSTGSTEHLADAARLERLDIATDDLAATFDRWRPEVVFHLAAQASVPVSIKDPIRDLDVNVIGTHRVAAAARDAGAARIVFVSSGGAVYGETTSPATEGSLPDPTSYYGIHKLAAEGHVALSSLPSAIVRPSNVYGPRQTAGLEGAVVAVFLEHATDRQTLMINGDGRQTRDFIHVDDVVSALCRVGQAEAPTGTWNVATGASISILELADMVEVAVGSPLRREHSAQRPGDVRHSQLSSARLQGLGWRPMTTLAAGIDGLVRGRSNAARPGP